MKSKICVAGIMLLVLFIILYSRPSYNGSSAGCSGGGCHSLASNSITVTDLGGLQVQITVSGVQSGAHVGGELVNGSGSVVASINSTSSNPFTLSAPGAGSYTVNAGYRYPSLRYGSASVNVSNTSSIGEENTAILNKFELQGNYPNPFNMETLIKFNLDKNAQTQLNVYNLKGQKIKTLINQTYNAGPHTVKWNGTDDAGRDLSSGTYLLQLVSGKSRMSKKVLLLK